jgi:hypothetical protein
VGVVWAPFVQSNRFAWLNQPLPNQLPIFLLWLFRLGQPKLENSIAFSAGA